VFADFPLGFATPEVAFLEVFYVGRMNSPVMAFTVGASSSLDETVIEGEVVPDGIPPPWTSGPEIRVIIENVLVDI
jgi:hypothetical protein